MNVVITPKDIESIVGTHDIVCNSSKEDPHRPAVAFVRIIHSHSELHYDYWAPICEKHVTLLQAGRLYCNVCNAPFEYKAIEWL